MRNSRITRRYAQLYETAHRKPEDERKFWNDVKADFKKRNVTPSDFSIRNLFEFFVRDSQGHPCGKEIIESWVPDGGYSMSQLEESGVGAVKTSAFSNITGQIVYNEILDAWNQPGFIADRLARTVPTQFLDGEKIAGISNVGDDAETVGEGQAYPLSGVTEAYVETPRPSKRGHILPLTRETIIADRTNVLIDRAQTISTSMRINKEKRVIDTAIGATTSWKRNGSTATATYSDSTTVPHDFDNLLDQDLVDYTDIEAAMQLFNQMTDPETGEPISLTVQQLLVSDALLYTARRIVNATEVEQGSISATVPRTVSPNPLNDPNLAGTRVSMPIEILSSPYVRSRASNVGTATYDEDDWYFGDFMRAFRYMEIWPLSTMQLPSNSLWEFQNDIVRAWKVSEFGVPAVIEPRYVIRSSSD